MDTLQRYFSPVAANQVLNWACSNGELPEHPILVTIDDGFKNNLLYAVPELVSRSIPAHVAITTGYIGTDRLLWTLQLREAILHWPFGRLPLLKDDDTVGLPKSHRDRRRLADKIVRSCKLVPKSTRDLYIDRVSKEVPKTAFKHIESEHVFLSWDDVRSLHSQGLSIGSHGSEHMSLAGLTDEQLDHELVTSKQNIEENLSASCHWLTYPFGSPEDVSGAVVEATRRAGYRCGLTLFNTGAVDTCSPLLLDRIFIDGSDSTSVFLGHLSGIGIWKRHPGLSRDSEHA